MYRLKNSKPNHQIDCSNVMNNATAALQMNESIKNTKKNYHIHILNCGTTPIKKNQQLKKYMYTHIQ